ncbi:tail assembly protein [Bacillus phage YungSlug]|nr:tail assembly protein [Bacillus phage YungSlug]
MENKQARLLGGQIAQGNKRTLTTQIDLTDINPAYVGTFKFHHPTVLERMQIGVMKTNMLGGMPATDVLTDNIAHMTAILSYACDEMPNWFKVDEIYDYEVLDRVYEVYNEWYGSFRKSSGEADNQGDSKPSAE